MVNKLIIDNKNKKRILTFKLLGHTIVVNATIGGTSNVKKNIFLYETI